MDQLDALLKETSVVTNHRVTDRLTRTAYDQVLKSVQKADVVILSLYLRTQVGRKLGLEPDHKQLAETILKSGKPVVVVTFGHPYAVESFPQAAGAVVAYEQSMASVRAVANVLTGRHEPRGRLPITIGPYSFGSGLTAFD
jgi:beta-N-acetylhexosaminidase